MSKNLTGNIEYILHFLRGIILGGGLVFGLILGYRLTPYALEVVSEVNSSDEVSLQSIKEAFPQVFAVYSGSMEPAIMTGSALLSVPSDFYLPGDVITFTHQGKTITHRIAEKSYENNSVTYKTKGDANEEADAFTISHESIQGKLAFSIPQLGYVFEYAKKPQGFILLVIVPATIIIYEELKFLFLSVKRLGKKLYQKVRKTSNEPQFDRSMRVSPLFTIIPLLGSIFVITAFTASYFLDIESSSANTLGVSSAYSVVTNEVMYKPDVLYDTEWIELYNAGSEPVSLNDWSLETDETVLTSLSGSIAPNERAVFELLPNSLNDSTQTTLFLKNGEQIIDIHIYIPTDTADISVGREPDGGSWVEECTVSTKGETNNDAC